MSPALLRRVTSRHLVLALDLFIFAAFSIPIIAPQAWKGFEVSKVERRKLKNKGERELSCKISPIDSEFDAVRIVFIGKTVRAILSMREFPRTGPVSIMSLRVYVS